MKKNETVAGPAARQMMDLVLLTVDQLKADLNKATGVATSPSHDALMLTVDGSPISWAIKNGKLLRYVSNDDGLDYVPAEEFSATFFPDAPSVLYRIGLAKGEQVRGYIFLNNLGK